MSSIITTVSFTGKEKREYAVNNIAYKLLTILQYHCGEEKGITQTDLFKKLFGVYYNDDDLKHFVMWDFVKKAMHRLRRDSNCFIVGNGYSRSRIYYVATTSNNLLPYIKLLKNSIKRMQAMTRRGTKAVNEKWYNQSWEIQEKTRRKLK